MEHIRVTPGDSDGWICICGNTPPDDGFFPCDQQGQEIEPGAGWTGLYVCTRCRRVIDQATLAVVGHAARPA